MYSVQKKLHNRYHDLYILFLQNSITECQKQTSIDHEPSVNYFIVSKNAFKVFEAGVGLSI